MLKVFGRDLITVFGQKNEQETLFCACVRVLGPEKLGLLDASKEAVNAIDDYRAKKAACIEAVKVRNQTTKIEMEKTRKSLEDDTGFPCKRCWGRICAKVYLEYGRNCKVCGTKDNLSVHHIVPRAENGVTEIWNLIPLCASCHDFVEINASKPRTRIDVIKCGIVRLQT